MPQRLAEREERTSSSPSSSMPLLTTSLLTMSLLGAAWCSFKRKSERKGEEKKEI
jgi:hypothetical protein